MTTVVARTDCKLWVLPFTHVNHIVETRSKVREHLEKQARMKLQFRVERFQTLRSASRSLKPAKRNKTSSAKKTCARTPKTQTQLLPSPSSNFAISTVNSPTANEDPNIKSAGRADSPRRRASLS